MRSSLFSVPAGMLAGLRWTGQLHKRVGKEKVARRGGRRHEDGGVPGGLISPAAPARCVVTAGVLRPLQRRSAANQPSSGQVTAGPPGRMLTVPRAAADGDTPAGVDPAVAASAYASMSTQMPHPHLEEPLRKRKRPP
jgi:hypothetical protein